ncbi:MAG TPA: response regulator [Bryobacteraceae bacterium]|jgi:DNA-binding response OmpR family regulator
MRQADAEVRIAPILIVDDQPENLWFLEDVLEAAGFTNCRTTTNARNAAAIAAEFQPELILLDLHMPEMDGIAVMRELGAGFAKHACLPVLMLTSDASPAAKETAFAAGAADFLTKPCSPAEILIRVRALLGSRV